MENELLNEGLTLMLAGMGTVFVFLTTLVAATSLMSRIVMRLQSVADDDDNGNNPTDEELAAVAAAVSQHRRS